MVKKRPGDRGGRGFGHLMWRSDCHFAENHARHRMDVHFPEKYMRDHEYRALIAVEEEAEKISETVLNGDVMQAIRAKMADVLKVLPESYSLDFSLQLQVFDSDREKPMTLVLNSLTCSHDGEPYQAHGDSSRQRYWVKGEICEVPHNYCPNCWEQWDFKFKNKECVGCGYRMGKDVKELLDDNRCPHCNEGKVSLQHPACSKCGQAVNPDEVWWG